MSTTIPTGNYWQYPYYSPYPTTYTNYVAQPISDADVERIAQRVAELLKPKPRARKKAT